MLTVMLIFNFNFDVKIRASNHLRGQTYYLPMMEIPACFFFNRLSHLIDHVDLFLFRSSCLRVSTHHHFL
jgi:hypothetical protein